MNVLCVEYKKDVHLIDERLKRYTVFDDVPILQNYDKVLFLHYDCIVEKDIVSNILEPIHTHEGVLYPFSEGGFGGHDSIFYGLKNYSEEQKRWFRERRIHPFSVGAMVFKPTSKILVHFKKAINLHNKMASEGTAQFYENSALNVYFNTHGNVDTSALDGKVVLRNIKTNIEGEPTLNNTSFDTRTVINHFCGIGYYGEKKIRMARFMKMLELGKIPRA
jgi:hypothetical protein